MSEQQTSPAANPWMRPMSAQLLVRKEPPRPAPVPVGPYTPNEPDENEAIYAARAAAARQSVEQNGGLLSPVQLAVEQAAQEAHAARQTVSEPAQPDAVFYQQATGVQQQQQEPQQPAQPVQPHRLPMSAYAVAQLENQAITRQADAAALADPMLMEEAQQTTQPRRRRMVMRQEREAAEATLSPAVQMQDAEEAESDTPTAEPADAVAEETADDAVTAGENAAQEAGADATSTDAAIVDDIAAYEAAANAEEACAVEEATSDVAEEAAEETASDVEEHTDTAAESNTIDTAIDGEKPADAEPANEEPTATPDASSEDSPATPAEDPDASCDLKLSQLDPAHPSEEYFRLPLVNPLKEYAWYTDDVLEEEDDPEEDCMDSSAMPVPVPVSTIDVPKVRRGKRVLSLLLALMLLLAAGGYLWISGHGEMLYHKAIQLVERLKTPTVSTSEMTVSPESAALPALLTVKLTTRNDISAIQLVDDADQTLVADITAQTIEDKTQWVCTVRMDTAYSGFIRAMCQGADGQWRVASHKRHIDVN